MYRSALPNRLARNDNFHFAWKLKTLPNDRFCVFISGNANAHHSRYRLFHHSDDYYASV